MATYQELLSSVYQQSAEMREDVLDKLPAELHLQALWFAGQMGREFETTDGKKVKIIQFGHWNHAAGPDFLHAAVEIDGIKSSGPLELDHLPSDWESHGHSTNPAFNDVILHVVFAGSNCEQFTRTSDHRLVPQVLISNETLRSALNYPLISVADAHPGRCLQPLAGMSDLDTEALLLESSRHRASLKNLRRKRTIDALGQDEWLWQCLAETLGYRPNKLAMTLLAQRVSIATVQELGDAAEAVIYGAAGFLTAEMHEKAPPESRAYLRNLWETWWQHRAGYEPSPERQIPWTFSGIRPVNHPHRRLGALVAIAKHWQTLKKLPTADTRKFLTGIKHPFWGHHYTLTSKRSERPLAMIGKDRVQDFLVNHLLPEKLSNNSTSAWELYQKLPAPAVSEKVNKASVRLFGETPRRKLYLKKAWQHQALLQIYQDFCLQDTSDCAQCPFPEQLAQWQR
ncbi:MAG: DUF2851 family protein [Akkermansiaceae bacterium]